MAAKIDGEKISWKALQDLMNQTWLDRMKDGTSAGGPLDVAREHADRVRSIPAARVIAGAGRDFLGHEVGALMLFESMQRVEPDHTDAYVAAAAFRV